MPSSMGVEGGLAVQRIANKNFRLNQTFVMAKPTSGNFFGCTYISVLCLDTLSVTSGTQWPAASTGTAI